MNYVIKRNGEKVEFDPNKIYNAILEANDSVRPKHQISKRRIKKIADKIAKEYVNLGKIKSVEYIQDKVEEALVDNGAYGIAKEYITYRYKSSLARGFGEGFLAEITKKITASQVENQNANVDEYSFGGRMGEANSVLMKKFALDNIVSKKTRENHLNNRIYIHDLDSYAVGMHNCLSIPFDKLLANGFNTRQTDVRPAGSVNTAFQLVAVIFQLQSLQQFGGVSATHLDWTMIPYVRKSFYRHWVDGNKYCCDNEEYNDYSPETPIDDYCASLATSYAEEMTEREIHQAVEGLYHNLNTLQSRSGNQLPFTSINYGTCTLPEGRMITKALLMVSIEGLGKIHKTSVFPCGIFQYKKGVNDKEGTPNYDLYKLALESTSKRLYPNYANVDWTGNDGYDPDNPCTFFSTINKTVA